MNSILHIASVTQHRDRLDAATYLTRKISEGKTAAKLDTPTSDTSPTGLSVACGTTTHAPSPTASNHPLLDKGASSPAPDRLRVHQPSQLPSPRRPRLPPHYITNTETSTRAHPMKPRGLG